MREVAFACLVGTLGGCVPARRMPPAATARAPTRVVFRATILERRAGWDDPIEATHESAFSWSPNYSPNNWRCGTAEPGGRKLDFGSATFVVRMNWIAIQVTQLQGTLETASRIEPKRIRFCLQYGNESPKQPIGARSNVRASRLGLAR
jgi:hypothetical protein